MKLIKIVQSRLFFEVGDDALLKSDVCVYANDDYALIKTIDDSWEIHDNFKCTSLSRWLYDRRMSIPVDWYDTHKQAMSFISSYHRRMKIAI